MKFATHATKGLVFSFDALTTDAKDLRFYSFQDLKAVEVSEKLVQQTTDLLSFIERSEFLLPWLQSKPKGLQKIESFLINKTDFVLPFRPTSFRDFYCFEEHVMNARKGRGLEMIPEWYEAPIFYYSNHLSFQGPFETVRFPHPTKELDFELELAAVVGRKGRDVSVNDASKYIFGYSIINDWTARDFQRFEMKVNMGPHKGKDFSTTLGHLIVTPDELEPLRSKKGFDVEVSLSVNGEELVRNNWNKIQFSFEDMMVRASKNCTVYPGEVFGSGTVGRGCLMEQNLQASAPRWIQVSDRVSLQWHKGGPTIENTVIAE